MSTAWPAGMVWLRVPSSPARASCLVQLCLRTQHAWCPAQPCILVEYGSVYRLCTVAVSVFPVQPRPPTIYCAMSVGTVQPGLQAFTASLWTWYLQGSSFLACLSLQRQLASFGLEFCVWPRGEAAFTSQCRVLRSALLMEGLRGPTPSV